MDFNKLYDESIELWPDEIDISDGKVLTNGVVFNELSSIWTIVEKKAVKMGEWYDLMTWVIFSNFHHQSKLNWIENIKIVRKKDIRKEKVKNDILQNLQTEGYEDMLKEFTQTK